LAFIIYCSLGVSEQKSYQVIVMLAHNPELLQNLYNFAAFLIAMLVDCIKL